jgi:hypothetical protein
VEEGYLVVGHTPCGRAVVGEYYGGAPNNAKWNYYIRGLDGNIWGCTFVSNSTIAFLLYS